MDQFWRFFSLNAFKTGTLIEAFKPLKGEAPASALIQGISDLLQEVFPQTLSLQLR